MTLNLSDTHDINQQNISHIILGENAAEIFPPDSTYWLASKVSFAENIIEIDIETRFVLGRHDIAESVLVRPLEQYLQPVSKSAVMHNVAISSGTFYLLNGRYLVTQRTADAKHDPSAWTTPAGRCDYLPRITALRETLEEIEIRRQDTGKKLIPQLCSPFVEEECDTLDCKNIASPNSKQNIFLITTKFRNQVVETFNAWAWLDESSNTLEIRIILDCAYENIEILDFSNPEFHTDTRLINGEELKHMDCTPSLSYYLSGCTA